MELILCPSCHTQCGKVYPATQIDPPFREGVGENFISKDGLWCCSEFCQEVMDGKYDEE